MKGVHMAKKSGARNYPIEIDKEDLKFRMHAAMHVAGINVADVADYMGIPIQYCVDAINGNDYYLSIDFVVNFCAICRCTITDVLPFTNDVIPFPATFTVRGGGLVTDIAPDPYRIGIINPESLHDVRWEVRPKTEF